MLVLLILKRKRVRKIKIVLFIFIVSQQTGCIDKAFRDIDQKYYESNLDGRFQKDREAYCQNYPVCLKYVSELNLKYLKDKSHSCNDKYLDFEEQGRCLGSNYYYIQMCLKLLVKPDTQIVFSHIDYNCGDYYKKQL